MRGRIFRANGADNDAVPGAELRGNEATDGHYRVIEVRGDIEIGRGGHLIRSSWFTSSPYCSSARRRSNWSVKAIPNR